MAIIGAYCQLCGEEDFLARELVYLPEPSLFACRDCAALREVTEDEDELVRAVALETLSRMPAPKWGLPVVPQSVGTAPTRKRAAKTARELVAV